MQFKDAQDLPIDDFLQDDTLLKITDSNPWYTNKVNFMVAGHVPPGADKKKLIQESRVHLLDEPYLYRVYNDGMLRRCVPMDEGMKIIEKCHVVEYGGHYGVFKPMQRFGKVISTGQPCTTI